MTSNNVRYYRLGDTISVERHVRAAQEGGLGRWTPVVVIDPEDRESLFAVAQKLSIATSDAGLPWEGSLHEKVAVLTTALREFANPTPPKPDEPTGFGAMVRDDEGDLWQRAGSDDLYPWTRITQKVGATKSWHDKWEHITAVEVLFEGVDE